MRLHGVGGGSWAASGSSAELGGGGSDAQVMLDGSGGADCFKEEDEG